MSISTKTGVAPQADPDPAQEPHRHRGNGGGQLPGGGRRAENHPGTSDHPGSAAEAQDPVAGGRPGGCDRHRHRPAL